MLALKFKAMDQDSTDNPRPPRPPKGRRGPEPDQPPQDAAADIDPATSGPDEDDESGLPEVPEEPVVTVLEGPLAIGHAAIEQAVRLAPPPPRAFPTLHAAHHG